MLLSLDTSLNLLWIAISVVCVGTLLRADARRKGQSRWKRVRHISALLLLALALFPSVSVSDDEVSFWFLFSHTSRSGGVGTPVEETRDSAATQHLAHVLHSLENCQVAGIWTLHLSLLFIALVLIAVFTPRERFRHCPVARAPPAF
jgi:hypothetical protein